MSNVQYEAQPKTTCPKSKFSTSRILDFLSFAQSTAGLSGSSILLAKSLMIRPIFLIRIKTLCRMTWWQFFISILATLDLRRISLAASSKPCIHATQSQGELVFGYHQLRILICKCKLGSQNSPELININNFIYIHPV